MNRTLILYFIIFCFNQYISQVSIGNTNKNSNVILDLKNSSNRGLLLPFSTNILSPQGNLFFDDSEEMLGIVLDNNNNSNSINYLSPWQYNGNSIVSLINSIKVGIGTTSPITNLHIVGDPLNNAANGSGGGGDFILGDAGSQHIVMDDIKIISKSNPITESTLQLQEGSNGHVEIGNHYTSNTWDPTNFLNGPVPSGGIIMWSGSSTSVPDGWHVCDGSVIGGVTLPNLTNKFIVGVGANNVGYTNGSDNITLTTSNLPNHSHTLTTDGSHDHDFTDRFHIETSSHAATSSGAIDYESTPGGNDIYGNWGTDEDNDRFYTIDDDTDSDGNHTHTVVSTGSGNSFDNRPQFYSLCYIIKL